MTDGDEPDWSPDGTDGPERPTDEPTPAASDGQHGPAADASDDPTSGGSDGESDATAGDGEAVLAGTGGQVADGEHSPAPTGEEARAALADEPLGESRRLNSAVRIQWVVGTGMGSLFAAVATAALFQFLGPRLGVDVVGALPLGVSRLTVGVAAAALFVFLGLATLRSVLLYRSWRYEVREDSLYLTRGVLTRVGTVAPYVRVQHIDTRRSPVERLLGLSSLVVYTAGSRGADVTIPGLTDDRAAELQTRLKLLAIETDEDEAV